MAVRCKVLNGLANSMHIINSDIAHSRQRRRNIDEYQRDLPRLQIVEKFLFHTERDDGNTFDAPFDHAAHGESHALGVVNRGCGQDLVIVLDGNVFKALNDFRKKGIGNFRNDETENPAAPRNERSGLRIGIVAEFFDNLPNAARKLRSYRGDAVDGPRNGGDRNLCTPCNFMNAQQFSPRIRDAISIVHLSSLESTIFLTFELVVNKGIFQPIHHGLRFTFQ